MKYKSFDFIIIGGGLAGATLGYLLKKEKFKVLIIEKEKIEKKSKLCGGILTEKSYNLLCKIFNKDEINSIIENEYSKVKIFSKYNIYLNNYLRIVDRKNLDFYIINKYIRSNGMLLDNTNIKHINFNDNTVICDNKCYKYNTLIAADGVLSLVRKELTGKIQRRNLALEIFVEKKFEEFKIDFKDNFEGYFWHIPRKKDLCIGIGNINENLDIKDYFENYLKFYNIDNKKLKGAFFPTGDDILLNYKNIYFIGDAAGLISPITGEGIYYALKSAVILYNCIIHNECNKYEKNMELILNHIKKELFVKKSIYNTYLRNFIFKKMTKDSSYANKIKAKVNDLLL